MQQPPTPSFAVAMYEGMEIILDNDHEPWMTQKQIAQMLGISTNAVTKAISRALEEGEYPDVSAVRDTLSHTGTDGKEYQVHYYNADVILMVGFRARRSQQAQAFRKWATDLWRMGWQQTVYRLENELYETRLKAHHATVDLEARLETELHDRYPDEEF